MKKKGKDWFPKSRPKQLVMFTNVKAKIAGYRNILPLTQEKIDRIVLICDVFIGVYNFVEQSRAKAANLTLFYGCFFNRRCRLLRRLTLLPSDNFYRVRLKKAESRKCVWQFGALRWLPIKLRRVRAVRFRGS